MTDKRLDLIWTQLLTDLEQPPERELQQMSTETSHLIELEIERLEREWPLHWEMGK